MPTLKYPITPEMHDLIRQAYQTGKPTGNGHTRGLTLLLARRIGYPRSAITRYAVKQGWIAKQKKEPDWSKRELRILTDNARYSAETVQRKLKTAGFRRSVTAIVIKRKRLRLPSNLEGYCATSLAACLGVDAKTVLRAIKAKKLKAERRGTKRTPQQGGDEWWIEEADIRRYILEYLPEIDIRKCDKYWLVGLLAEGR